ncbi:MAG: hypothetical protein GY826_34180, partial [Fuerstiella sp.]|nr:hypothetical protein [Fuerstiella sp.]
MPATNSVRGPAITIVIALAAVVAYGSMFTVNERELAVVLEFGKPVRQVDKSGL